MSKRKPTPRSLRNVTAAPKLDDPLPEAHPRKTGIVVNCSPVVNQPKKSNPILPNRTVKPNPPRILNLLVAITTYKRPAHLARLLKSLQDNIRPEIRRHIELLIVDDGSTKEDFNKIADAVKEFVKSTGCVTTLWPGQERLGRSRNKNRALWFFKERTQYHEILLLDDDVLFLHPDWWDRLRDSADKSMVGVLGVIPSYLSQDMKAEILISDQHNKTLNRDPGPTSVHSVDFPTVQTIYLRREVLLQVGYIDCTDALFANELEEFLRRTNRALNRNADRYYIIPNTSRSIVVLNDSNEDWITPGKTEKSKLLESSQDEVSRLHSRYQDRPPGYQQNKHHGLPDPHSDFQNSMKFLADGGILAMSLPRMVKRERRFNIQTQPVPLQGDEQVTVIIGHRGVERLKNLINTIESLKGCLTRPKIIVVEQDSFPVCRSELENRADQYIFTFSDRPYNRGWAFNVGAKLAETPYLLLHDNDLVVPEDYIESVVGMVRHAHAAICWGRISYLTEDSSNDFPNGRKRISRTITNEGIHGGSTIVRKDFYLQIGGFDERFEGWGAEDDAFYEKSRKLGKLVRVNPATGPWLYHLYHTHGRNKHQFWGRNKQLWLQYCTGTTESIRNLIQDPSEIGDPERGSKLSRSLTVNYPVMTPERALSLHVIYDVPGWAYWHRAEALRKYAPSYWKVTRGADLPRGFENDPPDVVLLLNYGAAGRVSSLLRKHAPKTILVGSMNVGWPRRLEYLMTMRAKCHHVVINNVEMYQKCGAVPGTSTISNGVDLDVFYPRRPLVPGRKPLALWTGSVFHASLKGFNIIKTMSERLSNSGIALDLRLVDSHGKKYTHEEMATWYNMGSCYIVASESEGTPNPALEAAACGLPVVATRVGNMPELIEHKINGYLLDERTPRAILEGLIYVNENFERMAQSMLAKIQPWGWATRSGKYFELFEMLLRGEMPPKNWNIPNSSDGELGKMNQSSENRTLIIPN